MNYIKILVIFIGCLLIITMVFYYLQALKFIKDEYKHKKFKIMSFMGTVTPDVYFTDIGIRYLRRSQILQMIVGIYFLLGVMLLWR